MDINPDVAEAMAAVEAVRELAESDPRRPRYHFLPPAQWLNDPNGTIYHNGWYHLFYQHNPFQTGWGPMYWGHARSRDLVRWEHLPIALWPSKELDETGCWSGCAAINERGEPMLFYTSVSFGQNAEGQPAALKPFEQWAAVGDADLLTWRKHEANPLFDYFRQGQESFGEDWRDPFLFHEDGRTFMVVGMCGTGTPLYEAEDEALSQWAFRGMISEISAECPNFFPLPQGGEGKKWVYFCSPFAAVQYYVGDFGLDTMKFVPEAEGILDGGRLDGGGGFYASNTLYDPDGRCVLFGWVIGAGGPGWQGCMALPRELWLGGDNRPRQRPVAELERLRGHRLTLDRASNHCEIKLSFERQGSAACGFRVKWEEKGAEVQALFGPAECEIMGIKQELALADGQALELRVFLDGCVIEVYTGDGRLAFAKPADAGVERPLVEALVEGEADVTAEVWEMASIW